MPRIARASGWLLAGALYACCCRPASAIEYDSAPVPPTLQSDRAARISRGAEKELQDDRIPPGPNDLTPLDARNPPQFDAPSESATEPRSSREKISEPARTIKLNPRSSPLHAALPGGDVSPLVTVAASLGIVLGLFLLVVWVMRRGMPKNVPILPREALEVLGRAPLVGRQQVHLVRCGNKILLLSVSPGGAETLSEITDPIEVDRLAGICQQANPNSVSSSFRQIFQRFEKKPPEFDYLAARQTENSSFDALDPLDAADRYRALEPRT